MPVNIQMSKDSPKIVLDEDKSVFLIEGASYMADAYKAYQVVLDWINESHIKFKDQLICEFKFNMLSSASRKMVYEILNMLNQTTSGNKEVQIHWYYPDYDDDMKEIGEVYAENLSMPFSFIPIEYH